MEHQVHEIEPVFDENSEILILGSFPSVKSREGNFFYNHPQNRFWKVLSYILECELPKTIEEKKNMLLGHHIAVWDVIQSCDIQGSSDSSICNVIPNDLDRILKRAKITHIYTNGGTADKLFKKYFSKSILCEYTKLPSTSPANARYHMEDLCKEWEKIEKNKKI